MLEKSSIEQALKKAKALVKKREFLKAQAIYSEILKIFPNNKKAQQGLMLIKKTVPGNSIQSPPQAALNELAALFSKGELSLVVQKSQDLVQHYPRNFVLWSFLGGANLGIGHATKAVQAFIKVTQLNPNYPEGYNNLGSALQQLGKYNESIKYFENAVLLKPDFSDAYYNNGISHQELNKLDLAIELYRKAIEITPNNWQAYANMGRAFKMLGELEKSLTAYNGAVAINSTDPELFSNIGNVFLDQDKLDEAIDAYKKAISLKPDYAEAYNNMGNALREQDKLDEAILCYQKSFTFKPNFSLAFNNMGTALKEQGKLEQAIELYKKALNLDPRNAEAYNNMGTILSEQEKSEDAIAAFKEALTLKPDYPEAYLNMGIAYAAQGKLEQAFKAYKKSLTLQPDFAEVYNNMGILLKDQGQLDEAIEAYNKAIDLKPDYATAFNNLGNVLKIQGNLAEAIEAYKEALLLEPYYTETYNDIGICLQSIGKLDDAIEFYNKATKLQPKYARAYNNMGNALVDQGKLKQAVDAYRKALKITPDYAQAARNLVKIPVGMIDVETVTALNSNLQPFVESIDGQSGKLFFKANLLLHTGKKDEAFKTFIQANHIKSQTIIAETKELQKKFDNTIKRITDWLPTLQCQSELSFKQLFLLGPSRSGKSILEQLLAKSPNIYPMFERIDLKRVREGEFGQEHLKTLPISELFYKNNADLLAKKYDMITSTSPESIFYIDRLIEGLTGPFCIFVKRNRSDIASEIFNREYAQGNFHSYSHSSILAYLDAYEAIWECLKYKLPHRVLEISFEEMLNEPQKVIRNITQLTKVDLLIEDQPNDYHFPIISPLREHFERRFMNQ